MYKFLAWRAENVSAQEISRRIGRGERSVGCLVAATLDLHPNIVLLRKKVVWKVKEDLQDHRKTPEVSSHEGSANDCQ